MIGKTDLTGPVGILDDHRPPPGHAAARISSINDATQSGLGVA